MWCAVKMQTRIYFHFCSVVPLSDPTCYAPVIDYVRTLAESMDDGKNYVVLLIITDGGISGESGYQNLSLAEIRAATSLFII